MSVNSCMISNRIVALLCVLSLSLGNQAWAEEPSAAAEEPQAAASASDQTQATAPNTEEAKAEAPAPKLTAEQLDSVVAPIALYPDAVLSQVLVASTYPLEIVQAYQWLQEHRDLQGQDLTEAAQAHGWDPSIQALVVFPDVLKRLNDNVTWTTNLGNAFLGQQADVMDAVQRMRLKAKEAGKLVSTEQQKVTTDTEGGQTVVEIEPANPQVVYVPEYDPVWIWGPAPIYWPYPAWYYPVARPIGIWFWWGHPVWVSTYYVGCCGWYGWGWRPGWRHHDIIVNNYFINRYNFTTVRTTNVAGTTAWRHDPVHRMGVAYPNRGLAERYRPTLASWTHTAGPAGGAARPGRPPEDRFLARGGSPGAARQGSPAPVRPGALPPAMQPRPSAVQVQAQLHEATMHRLGSLPVDHVGGRPIATAGVNRSRSVFGGIEMGTAARAQSNRGYSSLNQARINYMRSGAYRGGGHTGGVPARSAPRGGSSGGSWRGGGSSSGGGSHR